jgi:hypothetical protein
MITVKHWEPFGYSDGFPENIQTEMRQFANAYMSGGPEDCRVAVIRTAIAPPGRTSFAHTVRGIVPQLFALPHISPIY